MADDHAIVLDGIQALLVANPMISVVGRASDGAEALNILNHTHANILVTDYSMEGMGGLHLLLNVKKLYPHMKVVMLSMHDEPSIIQEVFRAGVDGYILKKHTHQELIDAINVVANGGQFRSAEINKILMKRLQPEGSAQLTDRELDVLKLLISELNTRQIAAKLDISERTVETHRKNLLRKTNSLNIVGLVKYAHFHNLI